MSDKTHNIFIRVTKKTKHYIKARARKNNRTLQQEIIELIEKAELHDNIKLDKKIV